MTGRKRSKRIHVKWKDLGRFSLNVTYWLFHFIKFLDVRHLYSRWRHYRGQNKYIQDMDGSVIHRPTLWSKLKLYIKRDRFQQRRRLLEWVQEQIPEFKITDFGSSWSEGIGFCALLEILVPGACPRYDLLRKTHKINNCRLALKIANKHLGIPLTILRAEDLANIVKTQYEERVHRLVSLMKWSATQRRFSEASSDYATAFEDNISPEITVISDLDSCHTSGCGLEVGLVGRRCKFDVYVPPQQAIELQIAIRGPNGCISNVTVDSLFPKQKTVTSDSISKDARAVSLWKSGTAKLLSAANKRPGRIQSFLEKSSSLDSKKIAIEYQAIEEGHFLISYVTQSEGRHTLILKWHKTHIRGSPFCINIADSIDALNIISSRPGHKKLEYNKSFAEELRRSEDSADSSHENSIDREQDLPCGVTAAVLNRTSKVQRSISRIGVPPSGSLPSQATVTRRRVLKRIITRGGQEIVIQEAAPTPVVSREVSFDKETPPKQNHINTLIPIFPHTNTPPPVRITDEGESIVSDILDNMLLRLEARSSLKNVLPNNTSALSPLENVKTIHSSPFSCHLEHPGSVEPPQLITTHESTNGVLEQHIVDLSKAPDSQAKFSPVNRALDMASSSTSTSTLGSLSSTDNSICNTRNGSSPLDKLLSSCSRTGDTVAGTKEEPNNITVHTQHKEHFTHCQVQYSKDDQRLDYNKKVNNMKINGNESVRKSLSDPDITMTGFNVFNFNFFKKSDDLNTNHKKGKIQSSESKPKLNELAGHRLRMSASLPSLFKRWNAFEIDADDDDLTINEMESLSIRAQNRQKRATLGTSELSSSLGDFGSLSDTTPEEIFMEMKRQFSNKSQQQEFSEAIEPVIGNMECPGTPSPQLSPMTNDSTDPQDSNMTVTGQEQEADQDSLAHYLNLKEDPLPYRCKIKHLDSFESMRSFLSGIVKVPKATKDKWTQVTYDEIKAETGWVRPTIYVLPRRRPLYCPTEAWVCSQAFEQIPVADNSVAPEVPHILMNNSIETSVLEPSQENNPDPVPVMPQVNIEWVAQDEEHHDQLRPARQLTTETNDSGIVEENNRSMRHVACRFPVGRSPGFGRPRCINGHAPVFRSRYKGKIALDPRLISNSPCHSPVDDAAGPLVSGKNRTMRYLRCRSISRPRGEQAVNDTELRSQRVRRAGYFKRRVRFCPRVMLHRRSSSRSSCNSRSTKTSVSVESPTKTPGEKKFYKQRYRHREGRSEKQWQSQQSKGSAGTTESNESKISAPGRGPQFENNATHQIDNPEENDDNGSEEACIQDSLEFDGFGVSASTRRNLLDEIDAFSRISETSHNETREKRRMSAPAVNSSNVPVEADSDLSFRCLKKIRRSRSDSCSVLQFHEGTDSSQDAPCDGHLDTERLPTEEALERVADYLDTIINSSKDEEEKAIDGFNDHQSNNSGGGSHLWLNSENALVKDNLALPPFSYQAQFSTATVDTVFTDTAGEDVLDPAAQMRLEAIQEIRDVPDPFRCQAFGAGLHYGTVNIPNIFQVNAPTSGNGSLVVSVTGPRPRTVKETAVTYTGDDLYEITYEVMQPGLYIINVKWADFHIPNSPFITQVNF